MSVSNSADEVTTTTNENHHYHELEDSTHKSAKTHAGTFLCLVTLIFDILTPK